MCCVYRGTEMTPMRRRHLIWIWNVYYKNAKLSDQNPVKASTWAETNTNFQTHRNSRNDQTVWAKRGWKFSECWKDGFCTDLVSNKTNWAKEMLTSAFKTDHTEDGVPEYSVNDSIGNRLSKQDRAQRNLFNLFRHQRSFFCLSHCHWETCQHVRYEKYPFTFHG